MESNKGGYIYAVFNFSILNIINATEKGIMQLLAETGYMTVACLTEFIFIVPNLKHLDECDRSQE